jgi:hypothetical protein
VPAILAPPEKEKKWAGAEGAGGKKCPQNEIVGVASHWETQICCVNHIYMVYFGIPPFLYPFYTGAEGAEENFFDPSFWGVANWPPGCAGQFGPPLKLAPQAVPAILARAN